ncbi:uncharacterized protein F4822DRAFT_233452 [Hypoxylon trugodes]|uniref:uncharacterized protein n=1 Tax=Hypoxylon trugodes TaxID=326681 RepID=UPI0021923563|nr:uncharacterized protein F4822DRAFT_233452 [Hypoxylon trugodes]KAI1390347.1 hypothetical protein F4822DRAFT_233452 [Hypoxylon trugodes]
MADLRSFSTTESGEGVLAREVFEKALAAFSTALSVERTDRVSITDANHGNLQSVLQAVLDAKIHYEARKGDSEVRKVLVEISEKIHFYSGIMDVLVSHHPEYVALAWGAMKFLFVGVTNHQKLICKLSAGLSHIASILPRAEITVKLYPHAKYVIESIYAQVMKFLMLALEWYQEKRWKHAIHAVTRPFELRFNDILESITALSRELNEIANTSSHAEQRDIHATTLKVYCRQRQLTRGQKSLSLGQKQLFRSQKQLLREHKQDHEILLQLQALMSADRNIEAATRVRPPQPSPEIQIDQILAHFASTSLPDPIKAFRASLALSNRHRQRPSNAGPAFWLDGKIQDWNSFRRSSLVMVKGTGGSRFYIRDFCARSIAILQEAKIPVIWALKTMLPNGEATASDVSTVSLLKYLTAQAIHLNNRTQNDETLSLRLRPCQTAETEDEWANILASVLEGIPLLYIIVDIEVLCQSEDLRRFWPSRLLKMLSDLSGRNNNTVIRVALVSYGSPLFNQHQCYQDLVVVVVRNSRQTRVVRTPRQDVSNSTPNSLELRLLANGTRTRHRLQEPTRRKRRNR